MSKDPCNKTLLCCETWENSSDRAGGNFKSFIRNTVKSGIVSISSCKEMLECCRKVYDRQGTCTEVKEEHSLRKVFYHEEIHRKKDKTILRRVVDTRKIHSIRNTGTEGVLEKRNMSCNCKGCFHHDGLCLFPEYSDPWVKVSVSRNIKKKDLQNITNMLHVQQNNTTETVPSCVERAMGSDNIPKSTMKSTTKSATKTYDSQLTTTDWKKVLEEFKKARTYDELKEQVHLLTIPPLKMSVYTEMLPSHKVDDIASNFYPEDGPKNMFPVQTYGDGNCFPRAISKLVFGEESKHEEICARIIISGVKNENYFTSNDILSRGEKSFRRNSISVQYVMYSGIDSTNTGRVLHPEVVEIYQKELLNLRNLGTYMGIWQFHQCEDVLQRPICSVYPEQTNPTVRRDMNRVILPLNESHINRAAVFIMWTPLHIYARAYDVKHFVPLVTKPVYSIFCTFHSFCTFRNFCYSFCDFHIKNS